MDVYSVTAVLFYMITGIRPLGVLQRALEEDTIADTLRVSGINEDQQAAIESGLALSAAQRPQNVLELMKSLKLEYVPSEGSQSQMLPCYSEKQKRAPIKLTKKMVIKTAAIFFTVAIPTVLIGGWIYIQHHYETTIAYVEEQKYDDAYNEWLKVPQVYKDTAQLGEFIFGNIEINYKNFEKARSRFEELGDYRDANEMFKEVDYHEGLYLLDTHEFNKSREIFKALGDYKDSKTMLLEVDYQEALDYLHKKEFKKAEKCFIALAGKKYRDADTQVKEVNYQWALSDFSLGLYKAALLKLKSLDKYKDSSNVRQEMVNKIYENGIEAYRKSDESKALVCFEAIDTFENSKSYLTLIEAKTTDMFQAYGKYQKIKELFDRLKRIEYLEDAWDIMMSDIFIFFMLEGYWKDGSNYISLKHDEKNGWRMSNNLPHYDGEYFDIKNRSILYGSLEEDYTKAFDLDFTSDYQLTLFCVKNNRNYYMIKR